MKVKVKVAQSYPTLCNSMDCSPRNYPGQNTEVGSISLLQGIMLTQELNWDLLHCRWILYQLSHKRRLRILEWVAYPFSRGSSWPRNQTGVFCIAGIFSTNWAFREAQWSLCPALFYFIFLLRFFSNIYLFIYLFIYLSIYLFIYLAASSLSCSTWHAGLVASQHVGSQFPN